jgi:hypothetical protein
MAPPPLRYAVQGFAALRRRESKWAGEKEPQEGIGKSAAYDNAGKADLWALINGLTSE